MASAKEIKDRMKSIKDTQKITNAMYMISSSKLQKAKKNLEDTEPYFYTLQGTIARLLRHIPELEHLYFDNRPKDQLETVKKKGLLVVTADKGLAGAFNSNVLKLAEEEMKESGKEISLFVVGELGRQFFARKKISVYEQFHYTAQNPTLHRARLISEMIIDLYQKEELDEVYVVYTRMLNSIQTEAEVKQILPLKRAEFKNVSPELVKSVYKKEIQVYPSLSSVIESIVPNYVTGFIYGALVESFASEQNSRMMAMEAANRSANGMLHDLQIAYNRVRQAAITQEISEVVSGKKRESGI